MRRPTTLILSGVLALGLLEGRYAPAAERVALIIGNSRYESEATLRNPDRDADAMEKALQGLGFTVKKEKDLNLRQMKEALYTFQQALKKEGLALFYYAGHGLQVRGENYLVPIGAKFRGEYEVEHECLEVARVLGAMSEAESNLKVVILDCCRDNPFKRSWKLSRSAPEKGLAGISRIPEATMIAFSTSQGKTADDGDGANSPYTEQLVKVLEGRPAGGLELIDVFRDASQAVRQRTGQAPWLNFDASLGKYYLWRSEVGSTPSPPSAVAGKTRTNSIGMELTLIPAGGFPMGSPDSDPDARGDEKPPHRVRITKPFYLGVHEVTVGQFGKFVEATRYKTDAESDGKGGFGHDASSASSQMPEYNWRNPGFPQADAHPVVNVSWNDAVAFCEWLSRKEGQAYRLPTEAQWEYACRAGTATRYHSGDDPETLAKVGNVADAMMKEKFAAWTTIPASDGYVFTAPVGQFRPNGFGLYDMHGNVWEWCADWYAADYYAKSPAADPPGASSGADRVGRGGGWLSPARFCRAARRVINRPEGRSNDVGMRVLLVAE